MSERHSDFILIVDDNPTNLSVLAQALKAVGLPVRVANDGESAIAQVHHKPPALILLDVQMPGIDGFETCRRLKADSMTQAIPVIFMTALTDTESKMKGFSTGAVDYITKPFEQEEVIARVRTHLRLKQLTDQLEQQVIERTHALQQAQVQLVQQEKLSSLGELIAGVAHEINNPIGFIATNLAPAKEYVTSMTKVLQLYQQYYPQPNAEIEIAISETDLEFAIADLPKILQSMQIGTERIKSISTSLRTFARADSSAKVTADLHEGLDSTLLILQHRLKASSERHEIKVVKDYGTLPRIECYPSQLNQVFMNLLANAIDALEENQLSDTACIYITTDYVDNQAMITIADNGAGMSEAAQLQVFKPLFTTKPAGKGTGLGLSISRQIIEEKHSGRLEFTSCLNQGTKFTIVLPQIVKSIVT